MAKIEVDEEDVRRLNGLQQTVSTLWGNPEARKLIQRAQKLVDPKAKTPDLDAEEQLVAPVKALEKKFEDYIAETKKTETERTQERQISELKSLQERGWEALRKEKYTDDGIKKIKELMDEKGILDPLDAAAIFDRANPPPAPVTPGGSGAWNFTELPKEGAEPFKALIDTKGQNDLTVDRMAWEAINEVRGVSRR